MDEKGIAKAIVRTMEMKQSVNMEMHRLHCECFNYGAIVDRIEEVIAKIA